MSGYEVREFCKTRLKHFWNESFGQIYPTLRRLNDEKLIRTIERNEKNGTRATYYEVTTSGLSALKEWLLKPPAPRIVRDELLLKLFCGREIPHDVFSRHVAKVRERTLEQLDVQKLASLELDTRAKGHPDNPYWHLILRYGELAMRARLKWCDEADELNTQKNKPARKKKS
jgi:PadR family transcriptional regulator, regulatory protein AphA